MAVLYDYVIVLQLIVGCCLATKSLALNTIKVEWVEVMMGVALGY